MRQKKDYKMLNIKLASNISDQLEQFCEETGLSKTAATEKIFEQFFHGYFSKDKEDRGLFKAL